MKRKCFKCGNTYKVKHLFSAMIGGIYLCPECLDDALAEARGEEENDRSLNEQSEEEGGKNEEKQFVR